MTDLFGKLKQYEQSQATKFPTSGTIAGIDGGFIDVAARGSSTIYRHVKVVGTPTSTGQIVVLTWENGTPTAHVTGGAGASGSDVALIRGPQGLEGPEGPAGPTGAQGPQGIQGATGAAGATGSQGIQGTQGVQGVQGTTGAAGTPGSKWYAGSGVPSGAVGVDGDQYLNTTNGDTYTKGLSVPGIWSSTGNIRGTTGSTGSQGIQGIQGPTGNVAAPTSIGFVEQGSAPASPAAGTLAVYAKTDHKVYKKASDGTETELGAGGGGAWGGITGTLSSQADLQAALDAKAASGHNHAGVYSLVGHDHAGVYSAAGHQHTSSQAIIHHANGATIAAGGTMYIVPSIAGLVAVNGVLWPLGGTFLNMLVRINSTQSNNTLVFTLQNALVDTALVVTVPAGSGAGSNFNSGGTQYTWPAGGLLSIKVKNNANVASAAITSWSIEFRAATL